MVVCVEHALWAAMTHRGAQMKFIYLGIVAASFCAAVNGAEVDCTNIPAWNPSAVYPEKGNQVSFEEKVYENGWWSSGTPPTQGLGDQYGGEWNYIADCKAGTASGLDPGDDPLYLDDAGKQALCSCFAGCAKNAIPAPVEVPAASKDDCYFVWCPDYAEKDDARCEEVMHRQELEWYRGEMPPGVAEWPSRVYAPYMDGGLSEILPIVDFAKETGIKFFVLAFVQQGSGQVTYGCEGALASVIPYQKGPFAWNGTKQTNDLLYASFAEIRKLGGDFTLSFGGAVGTELADSDECQSQPDPVAALKKEYLAIIDYLKLTHIDFDVEGNAVSSIHRDTGWKYRFQALRQIQDERPEIKIFFTLPILPTGLTADGVAFIQDMAKYGVFARYINVMTMDYGSEEICPGDKMGDCERQAIESLAKQVYDAVQGTELQAKYNFKSVDDVFPYLGSTPMLGRNDVVTENYSPDDARASLAYWQSTRPIGFIANWSLHRDRSCPEQTTVNTQCSSSASQTKDWEFAKIFAQYTSNDGSTSGGSTVSTAAPTTSVSSSTSSSSVSSSSASTTIATTASSASSTSSAETTKTYTHSTAATLPECPTTPISATSSSVPQTTSQPSSTMSSSTQTTGGGSAVPTKEPNLTC